MSLELQPFRLEAIDNLAQVVGDNYSGTEITRLFRRAGFPSITHDGATKWRFVAQQLGHLQQASSNKPHPILQVIEAMCNPQGYIGQREHFDNVLQRVNAVLEFYGCRVNDQGKVTSTEEWVSTVRKTRSDDERLFDERKFHPQIIRHARIHFTRSAYFHAVFECCKAFDAAVRANTHIDESGQPLMSKALSVNGPLKLNSQQTQSERDEQQGIMCLCMGLMDAVRNPQAHEPELNWPMSREDALDVLGLVSFLFRKLEGALVFTGTGGGIRVQL